MVDPETLRVAVVGATGYTGAELVRLLARHPHCEIVLVTSESSAGRPLTDLYPQFAGIADLQLETQGQLGQANPDVVFLALPHRVSMEFVRDFDLSASPVIDLSADFRIANPAVYEDWYETQHCCPELLPQAVYGLPELNRAAIRQARLVANPGCYPTCAILALAPLLKAGMIDPSGIVIDAKSGVTGAGVKPKPGTHFPTVNEGFAAYGLKRHRHTPEIEQALASQAGKQVTLQFTPHLLPVNRGILSTIYARPVTAASEESLAEVLRTAYAGEPFVRVVDSPPALDNVRGSNYCDVYATIDRRTGNALLVSVIDNLVKGAAGQAIQNMNLMFGMDETLGLQAVPLSP